MRTTPKRPRDPISEPNARTVDVPVFAWSVEGRAFVSTVGNAITVLYYFTSTHVMSVLIVASTPSGVLAALGQLTSLGQL